MSSKWPTMLFFHTSAAEEFELYYKLCQIMFEKQRFSDLQQVAFSVLSSMLFAKHPEIVKVLPVTPNGLMELIVVSLIFSSSSLVTT